MDSKVTQGSVVKEKEEVPAQAPTKPGDAIISSSPSGPYSPDFKGTQSFDPDIIKEAYKKYYSGESLEKINEWLATLGITSWKIDTEKKEKEGKVYEIPTISVMEETEGYLQDTNAEVSHVTQDPYDSQARRYGENPQKIGENVGGKSAKVSLSNVLLPQEMRDLLDGIDAVAQYEVLGDKVDEKTKERALKAQDLWKADSEAVNIGGLIQVAVQKHRLANPSEGSSETESTAPPITSPAPSETKG